MRISDWISDRVLFRSLATYDWALHLDASLLAQHRRGFAERAGVTRIDARVEDGELAEGGRIAAIRLDEGRRIAGDFFIDCTGFRSLLLGETLGVDYVDWGQWLPCDTAIAIQTENDAATPLPPHTRVIARDAGWQWRIRSEELTSELQSLMRTSYAVF